MEKHNYHNLRQRVAKLEHDLKRELQQQIESLQNKIDNAKKTRSTITVSQTRISLGENNKGNTLYKPETGGKNLSHLTPNDFYESEHFNDDTGRRIAYVHNINGAYTREISFRIDTTSAGQTVYVEGWAGANKKESVNVSKRIGTEETNPQLKSRHNATTGINTDGWQSITLDKGINIISCLGRDRGVFGTTTINKLKVRFNTLKNDEFNSGIHVLPASIKPHVEVLDITGDEAMNNLIDVVITGRQRAARLLRRSHIIHYTFTTGPKVKKIAIETEQDLNERSSDTIMTLYDKDNRIKRGNNINFVAYNDDGGAQSFSRIEISVKKNTQYWLEIKVNWNDMTGENQHERFKMRAWQSEVEKEPGDYDYDIEPLNYGKKVAFETLKFLNGPDSGNKIPKTNYTNTQEIVDLFEDFTSNKQVYEKVQSELVLYTHSQADVDAATAAATAAAAVDKQNAVDAANAAAANATAAATAAANLRLLTDDKTFLVNNGEHLKHNKTYTIPVRSGKLIKFVGGQQAAGSWDNGTPNFTSVHQQTPNFPGTSFNCALMMIEWGLHQGILFNFNQTTGRITNIRPRRNPSTAIQNPTAAQKKTAAEQLKTWANNDAWGLQKLSYRYV